MKRSVVEPAFCPNPECPHHHDRDPGVLPEIRARPQTRRKPKRWWTRYGWYETAAFGSVQRFRCKQCGRGFSTQTFSIDYYAKRIIRYQRLLQALSSSTSCRDMAARFSCSVETVTNRLGRFARNAIAAQDLALQELGGVSSPSEAFVADGFENFVVSQYFPNNIHLLAGKESQFLYGCNYVTLRRKGRMTKEQKQRREELEKRWRADPKGIRRYFGRILDQAMRARKYGQTIVEIYTDEKPDYTRALQDNSHICHLSRLGYFRHYRTSSRKPRTRANPLFSVNYLDRQLRKDLKECVRETVCFGRNVNNAMERLLAYRFHHNYLKPYRTRGRKDRPTHAEVAGVSPGVVDALRAWVFTARAFRSLTSLCVDDEQAWFRAYETPLKSRPEYVPMYAFD